MKRKSNIFLIIILLIFSGAFAEDSTQTTNPQFSEAGIKVRASVSSKEVPLNRPLIFTIQVEWIGELSQYEISEVEDPVVKNFAIKSNASSDRREMVDGKLKAIKTFEFEMFPQELGMGYIEGVIVKYIDTATGEGKHLITNRLDVKVIDPVAEPGSGSNRLKWIILILILIVLGIGIFWGQKHRLAQRREQEEASRGEPVEQEFLNRLKNEIPIDVPDLDIKDGYSQLSLIFRNYLTEKYDIAATRAITEEIIAELKQKAVADSLISNTDEILQKCDIAKFSGGAGERSELVRLYTLFEDILDRNLKETLIDNEKQDK